MPHQPEDKSSGSQSRSCPGSLSGSLSKRLHETIIERHNCIHCSAIDRWSRNGNRPNIWINIELPRS